MDTIFAGCGANDKNRVSNSIRNRAGFYFSAYDTCGKSIDQWVYIVAVIKINFSANSRDAECVAIVSYAFYNTAHQPFCFFQVDISEPQSIQLRYRAGAHGEYIPVYATYARCRSLIRLQRRWMVV